MARPWNDDIPDASLRLMRGTSGFLLACADALQAIGASGVTSSPVPSSARRRWLRAGFGAYLSLDLYRRDLWEPRLVSPAGVRSGEAEDWEHAVAIDREAFDPLWRLSELGLREAMAAAPRSGFLVTGDDGEVDGFSIVGTASGAGFLQRVAVRPALQGSGIGTTLVRASLAWSQTHGARAVLLNTQPDNGRAAAVYRAEGFRLLPGKLEVLRSPSAAAGPP